MSVAYDSSGQHIASGSKNGLVSVIDAESGQQIMKHATSHALPVRGVRFSPDGNVLMSASDDKHVNIYDPRQSHVVAALAGHASWVLSVDVASDGKRFATGSADNRVKVSLHPAHPSFLHALEF